MAKYCDKANHWTADDEDCSLHGVDLANRTATPEKKAQPRKRATPAKAAPAKSTTAKK